MIVYISYVYMLFRPFSEPGNLKRNGEQMICPKCKDTNPAQRCNNGMLRYVVFLSKMDDGISRSALEAASI